MAREDINICWHNILIFPCIANATRFLQIQPGVGKQAEVPAKGHL